MSNCWHLRPTFALKLNKRLIKFECVQHFIVIRLYRCGQKTWHTIEPCWLFTIPISSA